MLFQAVNTSIFLSLLIVLGNTAPSPHEIVIEGSEAPCRVPVAKGEGPPFEMISSSILEREWALSRTDDTLSAGHLLACGAANGDEEDEVWEVPHLKGVAIS